MGDHSSQGKGLPYSDPPPSYEESQKHEKVQNIPVAANVPSLQTEQIQNSYRYRSQQPFSQEQRQFQMNVYPGRQTFIPEESREEVKASVAPQIDYLLHCVQPCIVMGKDAFAAGARFTHTSPPSIPPPPPGVAPNAAQIAAQQGLHIVTTKKKHSFW